MKITKATKVTPFKQTLVPILTTDGVCRGMSEIALTEFTELEQQVVIHGQTVTAVVYDFVGEGVARQLACLMFEPALGPSKPWNGLVDHTPNEFGIISYWAIPVQRQTNLDDRGMAQLFYTDVYDPKVIDTPSPESSTDSTMQSKTVSLSMSISASRWWCKWSFIEINWAVMLGNVVKDTFRDITLLYTKAPLKTTAVTKDTCGIPEFLRVLNLEYPVPEGDYEIDFVATSDTTKYTVELTLHVTE